MKVTKLGHCCLVIEMKGKRFMTDPGNYTTLQNEAKNIDCVVISHEHTDHLHVESLKAVLANNPGAEVVANGSVGKILEKEGVAYRKVADGESFLVGEVEVSGHGTAHATIYQDYNLVENTGYLFGKQLFYPGDAFHVPEVPVDILAFPIGAPWSKIEESINYVLEVKPRVAIPVHDGNLIRHGLTHRLPPLYFSKQGIQFMPLEINKETEL